MAVISNPKNSVLLEQPMEQLSLTLNDLLFPGVVPLNPNYHTWQRGMPSVSRSSHSGCAHTSFRLVSLASSAENADG